jgi:hypothetical protein
MSDKPFKMRGMPMIQGSSPHKQKVTSLPGATPHYNPDGSIRITTKSGSNIPYNPKTGGVDIMKRGTFSAKDFNKLEKATKISKASKASKAMNIVKKYAPKISKFLGGKALGVAGMMIAKTGTADVTQKLTDEQKKTQNKVIADQKKHGWGSKGK